MWVIFISLVLSLGYLLLAFACVEKFHRTRKRLAIAVTHQPPVTLFKPVYGLSHEIKENLSSFCRQDYPVFQVIFGLHGDDDPIIPVIREIIAAHPDRDIKMVIAAERHGSNHKVSNLINMYPHAKHGIVLIADDDMRVPPDYLTQVVAPFADPAIGAVTCLYSGSPRGGMASALNAMFINEWFLPSVLVSQCLKNEQFCFGATMALRRGILEEIGGFNILADFLADDYMLGKFVADRGHRIHLSHFVVENIIHENSLVSMIQHELCWGRTIRTIAPLGYAFTVLTDSLVISIFAAAGLLVYTHQLLPPGLLLGATSIIRILFHLRTQHILNCRQAGSVWLIPFRDLLTFSIRLASYTGRKIAWKNQTFSVDNTGLLRSQGMRHN